MANNRITPRDLSHHLRQELLLPTQRGPGIRQPMLPGCGGDSVSKDSGSSYSSAYLLEKILMLLDLKEKLPVYFLIMAGGRLLTCLLKQKPI
jgi:hypothetical protein